MTVLLIFAKKTIGLQTDLHKIERHQILVFYTERITLQKLKDGLTMAGAWKVGIEIQDHWASNFQDRLCSHTQIYSFPHPTKLYDLYRARCQFRFFDHPKVRSFPTSGGL
jgi:hypothetical protein